MKIYNYWKYCERKNAIFLKRTDDSTDRDWTRCLWKVSHPGWDSREQEL